MAAKLVEGPGFELASLPIPVHLRPFVDSWLGYQEVSPDPVERMEYPTGRAVLIFEFGEPITIGGPVPGAPARGGGTRFRTGFFAGIDEGATLTSFSGHQAGVEVNLSPAGAFALTRGGLSAVAGQVVETAELGVDARLGERLREQTSWESRFDLVAQELWRRVRDAPPLPAMTQRALHLLDGSAGALRIDALSQRLGVSRKYLHERFVSETGFAPKRYAALRRFSHVKRILSQGASTLASAAQLAGYADQAHMTREVKKFAGMTPAELVRRANQVLSSEVQALLSGADESFPAPV